MKDHIAAASCLINTRAVTNARLGTRQRLTERLDVVTCPSEIAELFRRDLRSTCRRDIRYATERIKKSKAEHLQKRRRMGNVERKSRQIIKAVLLDSREKWGWGVGDRNKACEKHPLLICMPKSSRASKYPCHLEDKEDEVGREKLHCLMLTDKDRQLNKRDSDQRPSVARTQP